MEVLIMETKICSKCKQELSVSNFRWRNKSLGKLHSQCKNCEKQSEKIRYAQSKERQISVLNTAIQQKERNILIVEEAKQCGCQKCNEKRLYLMEFHHINPEEKINTIAHMIKSASESSLKKELSKCIVLCANCHREFHYFNKINNISIEEYLGQMAYAVGAPD